MYKLMSQFEILLLSFVTKLMHVKGDVAFCSPIPVGLGSLMN